MARGEAEKARKEGDMSRSSEEGNLEDRETQRQRKRLSEPSTPVLHVSNKMTVF